MADKECKDINCTRNHFWFEDAPDGKRFICFHAKGRQKHVAKVDIAEIVFTSIRKAPKFARSLLEGLEK